MKKCFDAIEAFLVALYVKLMYGMRRMASNEAGDTNFISILIILGIVIIVAGVFMRFKDDIVGKVRDIVDGFTIH